MVTSQVANQSRFDLNNLNVFFEFNFVPRFQLRMAIDPVLLKQVLRLVSQHCIQ
jgi:hypothetical protein